MCSVSVFSQLTSRGRLEISFLGVFRQAGRHPGRLARPFKPDIGTVKLWFEQKTEGRNRVVPVANGCLNVNDVGTVVRMYRFEILGRI